MAKSDPNVFSRTRIQLMTQKQALAELRKRTLNGETGWVTSLLEKTGYETIADYLEPATWKEKTVAEMKNIGKVVRHILRNAPQERLPPGTDPDRVTAEFDQAVLRLLPKPKIKTKR